MGKLKKYFATGVVAGMYIFAIDIDSELESTEDDDIVTLDPTGIKFYTNKIDNDPLEVVVTKAVAYRFLVGREKVSDDIAVHLTIPNAHLPFNEFTVIIEEGVEEYRNGSIPD